MEDASFAAIKSFYGFLVNLNHRITKRSVSSTTLMSINALMLPRPFWNYRKIASLILRDFAFLALTCSFFSHLLFSAAVGFPDGELHARLKKYEIVSTRLTSFTDTVISEILQKVQMHSNWRTTCSMEMVTDIGRVPVFIKTIPLTKREVQSERSTENLFDLPLYYQYGVGSAGFGVWRELSAYLMSTNWVLTGECQNFPLVYHWRVLAQSPPLITSEQKADLERRFIYWEQSIAIRTLLVEKQNASSVMVIFMECIPETLETWLNNKFAETGKISDSDITMVDTNLKDITTFINSRGLLHFDMHFRNILTDGKRLYLADFGLATSLSFQLSAAELEFFEHHSNYDRSCNAMHLVNWLVIHLFGEEKVDAALQEYANGLKVKEFTPLINSMITRYTPAAIIMNDFFRKLRNEKKTTPYPGAALDEIFRQLKNEGYAATSLGQHRGLYGIKPGLLWETISKRGVRLREAISSLASAAYLLFFSHALANRPTKRKPPEIPI